MQVVQAQGEVVQGYQPRCRQTTVVVESPMEVEPLQQEACSSVPGVQSKREGEGQQVSEVLGQGGLSPMSLVGQLSLECSRRLPRLTRGGREL